MTALRPAWLEEDSTRALIAAFAQGGAAIRFVGGCVRDTLMQRPVGDIDAATPATPETVMALLQAAGIKVIPTGLKHGTVTAIVGARQVEITTLREDAACDGRHAEVRYTDDWERDASRRDFTMNALYLAPEGEIFDYFHGREDLTAGRLRFIGEARARIREDYLRILRFFRFYATHANPPADAEALTACREEAAGIDGLSGERIRSEMLKLLAAPDPLPTLRMMEGAGVLPHLLIDAPNFTALEAALAQDAPADPMLRLVLLLEGADGAALAERWRLSGVERKRLLSALAAPLPETWTEPEAKALLRRTGEEGYRDILWRWRAAHPEQKETGERFLILPERWEIPAFPIGGDDLLARGIAPGKAMGDRLKQLEAQWEASNYTLGKEELLRVL